MNSSPLTTWEGAEAYFTWADSPMMMGLILLLAVIVCFGTIFLAASHEKHAYKHYRPK